MAAKKKKKKQSSSKNSYDEKKRAMKAAALTSRSDGNAAEKKPAEPAEKLDKSSDKTFDTAADKPSDICAESCDDVNVPEKLTVALPDYMAAPIVEVPHSDSFLEKDFSESVSRLGEEDIMRAADRENKKSKKPRRKLSRAENLIQLALLAVFGTILVVCIVMLGKNVWGKIQGNSIYKDASQNFSPFTEDDTDAKKLRSTAMTVGISADDALQTLYDRISSGESDTAQNNKYSEKLAEMKASLTALKAVNDDVYGWIYVEGTTINYPILLGENNDYYLDHAYTGEYLPIGSIFLDFLTKSPITDNYNAVIYGHNVVTGAMFHDVTKFLDEDFFEKTDIYIYTMDGVFIYKPVSIYPTTSDYYYYRTDFAGEQTFLDYANEMIANSKVASKEKFVSGDTMITLSTCTNGAENGRYALHAKLIETIK